MLRLIPHQYPNYFSAPGLFTWWGDPVRWEMAVLVVAAICAFALFLPRHGARTPLLVASALAAPFIFGLAATVFQIHMIFYTLASAGWSGPKGIGPGPEPWDDVIYCGLFSSHIGLFSSLTLLLVWLCVRAFRRATNVAFCDFGSFPGR